MWLGWKRLIPADLVCVMVTTLVNTEGVARNVRLGVFAVLFLVILMWVARGDPRLAEAITPQRRAARGAA